MRPTSVVAGSDDPGEGSVVVSEPAGNADGDDEYGD